MKKISRRDWLKYSTTLCTLMGLSPANLPKIANSVEQLAQGNVPVLWLQGLSCSGCSVSFLNTDAPGPAEILTQMISLRFHSTLSTATGEIAMDIVHKTIEKEDFYLVMEGAVPEGMPSACRVGDELLTDQLIKASPRAKAILAVGACAAFGGIPSAEGNPAGAISLPDFLQKKSIKTPLIRLPGCPCHPDWLVGTLVHVLSFGLPELDTEFRPAMFYRRLIHDQCPRFADYERENFARTFSEEGCLFKLGCQGPVTHADCTIRGWNSAVNTCIKAGAPCIGCAGNHYARQKEYPFYRKDINSVSVEEPS